MALNRAYIGQEWEAPVPYEVGVEKVREFAVAIGAPDTDGFVRSALDPDSDPPAVPPTFVTSMWFRMGVWPLREPDFGKSATPRFLLGEQQVTRHRPMVVGDRVLFRTRVRDIRTIGAHELLEMEHSIVDLAEQPVCSIVDKMISRGTAPEVRQS